MAKGQYQKWLEKDNLILLEGWARDGLTHEQIAHNMGIGLTTLKEWRKKYEPIEAAIKKGKEVVDYEVENALVKRALGFKAIDKVYERDIESGELVVTKVMEKEVPPDTTAQIFWLKNRRPDKWKDRPKSKIDTMEQEVRIEQMKASIEQMQNKNNDNVDDDGVVIINDV